MKQQVNEPSGAALVARIKREMAEEGLEPDAREVEFLAIAEGFRIASSSSRLPSSSTG